MTQAVAAIKRLREHVDTVIVVSNDRLLDIIPEDTPMNRAFAVADDILRQGVVGISDIIIKPGLINVDFADVRSVMSDAGTALMGIGIGSGKTGAEDAAGAAISSPLLDSTIDNAKGVVFNISGGSKLTLTDVNRAAQLIYDSVEEDANVIFGALIDDSMQDEISLTVLATGFATGDDYLDRDSSSSSVDDTDRGRTTRAVTASSLNDVVPDLMSEREAEEERRERARRRQESAAPVVSSSPSRSVREEEDDDDDRNEIPGFLRRLKKNRR